MSTSANGRGFGPADWLMNACRQNPEGLLLLAAGCALLLRTGSWRAGQRRSGSLSEATGEAEYVGGRGVERELPERVSRSAANAGRYMSEFAAGAGESARSYASAGAAYAQQAGQTITTHSQRLAGQTQSVLERIAREQPLAIALAGLAVGAAVAAAFPLTRLERERLGPAGQRLSQAAGHAREKLTEAVTAAGERAMDIAQGRGISAEGLKEAGRDVAGTFSESLSEGGRDEHPGSNKNTQSRSGGSAHSSTPSGAAERGSSASGASGSAAGSSSQPKYPSR